MLDRYQEATADPELLATRDEVALLDARIANLLLRLEMDEGHDATWDIITQTMEARRRLVESEQKRLVAMRQMLTTEQAMTFLAAIVEIVRRHVTDRAILTAISTDLVRLTTQDASRASEPA